MFPTACSGNASHEGFRPVSSLHHLRDITLEAMASADPEALRQCFSQAEILLTYGSDQVKTLTGSIYVYALEHGELAREVWLPMLPPALRREYFRQISHAE
ncbi:DUF7674 family protein [Siphonobacter aquaeclarae]|nr:hypothetical protein [Siphonobacter aquaeclarae]